jgi:hypothetical protein
MNELNERNLKPASFTGGLFFPAGFTSVSRAMENGFVAKVSCLSASSALRGNF